MPTKSSDVIELVRLERADLTVRVVGTSPLIIHKWSEKAKRMLPGYPEATASERMSKKGAYIPEEEATACLHMFPDGAIGFPAAGFKHAMVGACRFYKKPSMTEAKLYFFVKGDPSSSDQLVRIFHRGQQLREDICRNSNGGPDLRYRYQFFPWWASLTIDFLPTSISASSIIALVDAAGSVGIGDWRPGAPEAKNGTYGTFRVMLPEEEHGYEVE